MFADHPVRKQAFLDEKTHRFYTVDILGLVILRLHPHVAALSTAVQPACYSSTSEPVYR